MPETSTEQPATGPFPPLPAWADRPGGRGPDGEAYRELLAELRRLQHAVATAAPPAAVTAELLGPLREATERLAGHAVPERARLAGGSAVSGPGHPLLVPYTLEAQDGNGLRGTVEFGAAHLGGGGAVHGGMLPLLFDDFLGIFVSMLGGDRSRTAFLTVNYRRITVPSH